MGGLPALVFEGNSRFEENSTGRETGSCIPLVS